MSTTPALSHPIDRRVRRTAVDVRHVSAPRIHATDKTMRGVAQDRRCSLQPWRHRALALALGGLVACAEGDSDLETPPGDLDSDPWAVDTDPHHDTDGSADDPCAPHGIAHFDHCHCNPGYRDDGQTCVPIDSCRGTDPFEPDDRTADAQPWSPEMDGASRWLCPGDRDLVLVPVEADVEVVLEAAHDDAEINVDLTVWLPGADPRFDEVWAREIGQSAPAVLRTSSPRAGDLILSIRASDASVQGAYTLTVEDTP